MRVIGIDIDKIKIIFYALETDTSGNQVPLSGSLKYLTLEDDTNNSSVRAFQSRIHAFFDELHPARIAILKRQTTGRFKSSPLSFKIEGLIQCYQKVEVEFIQPMAVSGYFKKHAFNIIPEFEYQIPAAKLASYMLALV
jgi:hypothetical protein